MLKKPTRPKEVIKQDRNIQQTVEDLKQRYDLDNLKIMDDMDDMIDEINSQFIIADDIKAKTIKMNRLVGDKLTLGGADNISGELEVLDGSGNNMVNIDKNGITLSNGAELIGSDGVLSYIIYNSNGLDILGINEVNWSGLGLVYGYIDIECVIPENFTITNARCILTAYKTKNYYQLPEGDGMDTTEIYGKITNIKFYKQTSSNEWSNGAYGGFWQTAPQVGTEILNAFNTGNYTNPTSNEVTVTSINIANKLTTGKNNFFLKTSEPMPNQETNTGVIKAASISQFAKAVIIVSGYVS